MKIAIIGYGKMGREIEKIVRERKHEISAIIDNEDGWQHATDQLKSSDVAIEFSTPETVLDNLNKCFELGLPVVSGTTGWNEQLQQIKKFCIENKKTLFFSPNFSLGVNIFFAVNKYLAKLMATQEKCEVNINEVHHSEKKDAPSGTAIALANDIIKEIDHIESWVASENSLPDKLSISSVRKGDVTGVHHVKFEMEHDAIAILHSAKSRTTFALGAVKAAEWVAGRKGYFEMKDMLGI